MSRITATPSVRFSEIQVRYVAEMEQGANWTEKTKNGYIAEYDLFIRVMGTPEILLRDAIENIEFNLRHVKYSLEEFNGRYDMARETEF